MQPTEIPTVRELIDRAAERYEDRTFLMFVRNGEVQERSFRKTQQDSLSVCRYLRYVSDRRMHVAIMSKTSYDYITCLTGILMSGNVALPLSPDISEAEASMLLERADVEFLFYGNEISEKVESLCRHCVSLKKAVCIGTEQFARMYDDFGAGSQYVHLSDYTVDPEACAA
ncbi:MAG: AMP-binding protein, partial [Lachnospiraceae bacterium]|nr:AMP-binding protein [Lachnospiraceae bacterium]